ncbi:MAG TPA: ABC-2 family transporter protein [Kofleriaceae bacterium]
MTTAAAPAPRMRSTPSRVLRAMPTLLRIGVAETVAYRAEFLVWILTTTQPLIMLGLWTSVARFAAFKNWSSPDFVAYFLACLIVRQLTGNWVAWQMSEEVRSGSMAMRLLRPVHPFFAYVASHAAAIPFRSIISVPVALLLLASSGMHSLTSDPVQLALVVPSIALAWLITFAIMFAIGALAFFVTQTMAVANLYFGLFSLFSGYLMPLDLLPPWIAKVAAWLPFRFMLSAPVELLTGRHSHAELPLLLGAQAAWAAITLAGALALWRAGVRRFESVGG